MDSSSCSQCVALLKRLAKIERRTIICTIHQPSALLLEMFDAIYAVAGGYCIYRGSVKSLLPHMSSIGIDCPPYHNPADFRTYSGIPFGSFSCLQSNHTVWNVHSVQGHQRKIYHYIVKLHISKDGIMDLFFINYSCYYRVYFTFYNFDILLFTLFVTFLNNIYLLFL